MRTDSNNGPAEIKPKWIETPDNHDVICVSVGPRVYTTEHTFLRTALFHQHFMLGFLEVFTLGGGGEGIGCIGGGTLLKIII